MTIHERRAAVHHRCGDPACTDPRHLELVAMGDDLAAPLRMTAADAEHDANCEHFQEAAWLARAVLEEDERVERLEAVARAARNLDGAWAADGVEFRAAQDALRAAIADLGDDDG